MRQMFAKFWMPLTKDIYSRLLLRVKNHFLKHQRFFLSIYSKTKYNSSNIDKYTKTGKNTTWKDVKSSAVTKHLRDRTANHPLSQLVQAQGFLPMLKRTIVVFSDTKDLTAIFNPR